MSAVAPQLETDFKDPAGPELVVHEGGKAEENPEVQRQRWMSEAMTGAYCNHFGARSMNAVTTPEEAAAAVERRKSAEASLKVAGERWGVQVGVNYFGN